MLRIKALGGLSIERDGRGVTGPAVQRRRLALLAVLASTLGDKGLTREKTAALLWPESDEDSARNSLKQALSVLRRELGTDLFVTGVSDLRLNPEAISSDVHDFESAARAGDLERAASVYGGPFLDGFHLGSEAEEFERWTDAERSRLAWQFVSTLEMLATTADREGNHRVAAGWWRRLTALDPLNARHAVGLVEALLAAGDRAGALKHVSSHSDAVRRELGGPVDPAIEQALHRVRGRAKNVGASHAAEPTLPQHARAVSEVPSLIPTPVPVRRRRGTAAALGIALVLLLSASGLLALLHRPSPEPIRVAVLPFENLGPTEDSAFALGLTDELTTVLAARGGMEIVAKARTGRYARSSKTVREIGRELQADYLLEGGIFWSGLASGGGRVRITPKLIRVVDERHVWAEVLESDASDLFGLQGRVAEQVAGALNARVRGAPETSAAPPTSNPDAYTYYVRGVGYLDHFDADSPNIQIAIDLHTRAVQLDPRFAMAWAKLSGSHSWLYWRGYDTRAERAAAAKAAADSAVRLQPDLPEARMALGWYYGRIKRDFSRALKEFKQVYQDQPYNDELLTVIGAVERRMGRYNDAADHLRRAVNLGSRSSNTALMAGLVHTFIRDYAEADRFLVRAISLQPDWAIPYAARAHLHVAWRGDTGSARRVIRAALSRVPLGEILGHFSYQMDVGFAAFLVAGDSLLEQQWARITAADFRRLPHGDVVYYLTRAYFAWADADVAREHAFSDSARALLEQVVRTDPEDDMPDVWLAIARAGLADSAGAVAAANRAISRVPIEKDYAYAAERGIVLAQMYTRIGDHPRALVELERLIREPSPASSTFLSLDPTWKELRGDPRFARLAGEAGILP